MIILLLIQSLIMSFIGSYFFSNDLNRYRGFYKIVGIVFVFLPLYLLCSFFNLSSFIAYPIILFFYLLLISKNCLSSKIWKNILKDECIFIFLISLFLIIYAWGPALQYGEKPMDLGALAFFNKFPKLPTVDPWFASERFNYYDFGYFLFGTMTGYLGTSLELKYYLSLSFVAALSVTVVRSILDVTKGERNAHIVLAPLFLLIAPFVVLSYFNEPTSVALFWKYTRVFKDGLFFEFPLWSFLFSDLHAHVMMIPFSLTAIFFWFKYFYENEKKRYLVGWLSCSLILILGNTWDFLWGTIFLFPFVIATIYKNQQIFPQVLKDKWLYLGIFLCALISFYFLLSGRFQGTNQNHFLTFEIFEFGILNFVKSFGMSYLLFLWASFLWIKNNKLMGISFFVTGNWALLCLSVLILNDRLNSIFKGGSYLYLIMTVASLVVIYYFLNLKKMIPVFIYSGVGIVMTFVTWQSAKPIGQTFAIDKIESKFTKEEKELINYLNHQNADYSLFTPYLKTYDYDAIKLLSFTGVPLVMGWDNHVFVRGKNWHKLKQVERDMNQFYNNPTNDGVKKLFEKYQMDAIYFPHGTPGLKLKFNRILERE